MRSGIKAHSFLKYNIEIGYILLKYPVEVFWTFAARSEVKTLKIAFIAEKQGISGSI